MSKRIYSIYFILFFCFVDAFAQTPLPNEPTFNKDVLFKHLKNLSSDAFEGRRTGTKGATKAKHYIINEFSKLKINPLGKTYEQPFQFINKGKQYIGVNVLGCIKGAAIPDKYIVISAHYDHEGIKKGKIYNGADDNASGVSALFSFAEFFKNHQPRYSVILAAFDAEELGLKGSSYFVDNSIVHLKDIVLNINMDMISRSDKFELFVVGTKHHEFLKNIILNTKGSGKLKLKIGHEEGDWKNDWTDVSDHANFHQKHIPFLYFGVEDHKDYHEPTDDYENVDLEFYNKAVCKIISIFTQIDRLSF